MRILVVEDDGLTADALSTILAHQNYVVEIVTDGKAALELIDSVVYDLLLVDVMLPQLDGISLCRQLRSQGLQMPILLVTGRDSSHDKTAGLDAGADDYLVKPFDPSELAARVRALLRRGKTTAMPILEWGGLQLNPSSCEVFYDGRSLPLTPKEYALLELFLRNSTRVFSCGVILEQLWSFEETPGEEAVRTHIKGLRQKLKAAGAPGDLVETVYGIGYRLKPLAAPAAAPSTESSQSAATATTTARQQTITAIAAVWERFKANVFEQVALIEHVVTESGQIPPERLQQALKEAHTLAGSLGTFGFPDASKVAKKIETLLEKPGLDASRLQTLHQLVITLRDHLQPDEAASTAAAARDDCLDLLIVDREECAAAQLQAVAQTWGLRSHRVDSVAAAQSYLQSVIPQLLVVDLTAAHSSDEALRLLSACLNHKPAIPVIVYSAQDALSDRLSASRLGVRAFLHKPLPPEQVLETVTQVLSHSQSGHAVNTSPDRILIVDDDPKILSILRTLLEPWGFRLMTLSDPRRFWDVLESTLPDLLVLDVKMPHVSGIELCQVLRNDPRWSNLPVLFLTAHTNADVVHQVFAVGGDDFVTKPIVGPELITRILNRLDRIRYLRRLAEVDPLTGLANRQRSTIQLQHYLRLAHQQRQPVCFGIIDLDQFRTINVQHGHAVGDRVLAQVGRLLEDEFGGDDIVARWGGEEFVIGLYGASLHDGMQRLDRVLRNVRQYTFIDGQQQRFRVTFSAGLAHCPDDGTDLQTLYQMADRALHQAKQLGRDRILATAVPEPSVS